MSNQAENLEQNKKLFEVHIATLGVSTVGKTSLIFRYMDNTFTLNYLITVGIDSRFKRMKINDEEIKVIIADTAGQERYKAITSNYTKKANGILLIYDITNQDSFEEIKNWAQKLKDESGNLKPIVIIGNKNDLEDERVVCPDEGEQLAETLGEDINFYETSCKTGENVEEAINNLIKQVYKKYSKNKNNGNQEIIDDKKKVQLASNKKIEKEKRKFC